MDHFSITWMQAQSVDPLYVESRSPTLRDANLDGVKLDFSRIWGAG